MQITNPLPVHPEKERVKNILTPSDTTRNLLNRIFPEQQREDKVVKQTRALLGNLLGEMSTEDLEEVITLMQYLSESWLDMYERKLYDGMTLNELLSNG